jgi:hypothetical protein
LQGLGIQEQVSFLFGGQALQMVVKGFQFQAFQVMILKGIGLGVIGSEQR